MRSLKVESRETSDNKNVSGYAGFARSTYMAFKRVWPGNAVQGILDQVRVDWLAVATSETSERYTAWLNRGRMSGGPT
jgi:hypothetical protein